VAASLRIRPIRVDLAEYGVSGPLADVPVNSTGCYVDRQREAGDL